MIHLGEKELKMFDMDIEDLIPHRDGMKLIEKIIELNAESVVAEATVTGDWPLYEDGFVDSLVLIELAAQTAGLSISWGEKQKTGGSGSGGSGWLVGIRKASFSVQKIPVNTRIKICTKNGFKFEKYIEISGTAEIDSQTVGEVVLQVFGPDISVEGESA